MVKPLTCEMQAVLEIFRFQIGKLLKNLCGTQAIGQQVKNVGHGDAHSTNAGLAPRLPDSMVIKCW